MIGHINILPSELIEKILSKLKLLEQKTFITSNKYYFIHFYSNLINKINTKKNIIIQIPNDVAKIFNGYYNMIDFPILKWKSKYIDSEGNISLIPHNDLNNSIMIGFDTDFNRPFIVVKTKLITHNNLPTINYGVDIFFQRLKDISLYWSNSSSEYGIFSFLKNFNYQNSDTMAMNNLKKLINNRGKYIILDNYLNNCQINNDYDIIKRTAAIII